jgi:HK97 family phage major capsid protein
MATLKELLDANKKAMEAKLKEHAKDAIVEREKKTTSGDRELVTRFYKALASKDQGELNKVNADVTKAYLDTAVSDEDYSRKAQDIGTAADGGVLVPTTVADSIVKKMLYVSPVRQIATVISNMPAQLQLPSEVSLPQWNWVSEGAPGTDSSTQLAPNLLVPFKHMGLDSFTSEVIADAATNPSIQNFVEDRFAISGALHENAAFVNGDGVGKPYGFRSSAITPSAVAQIGAGLAYKDLVNLQFALPTAYRMLGTYVLSSAAVMALENVKDGYGRPIWRDGLSESNPAMLLGRPAVVVDEIPANLGAGTNATEVWFGLFSNYYIGDRGGLRVDYGTNANDFANDKITLRVAKRVAGRPVLSESFAKLTGVISA